MDRPFFPTAVYHNQALSRNAYEETLMTVLEIEPPLQPTLVIPFPRAAAAGQYPAYSQCGLLVCPNIAELPTAPLEKARLLLEGMSDALFSGSVECFNESKRQLVQLIRKHGSPITQWNPLTLILMDAYLLKGAKLAQVNFEQVRLLPVSGRLSLEGADLQGAAFLCADLNQADLTDADLTGADLRFADLRECNLERAMLIETDLSNAKLSLANLDGANLYCAKLNGAIVKEASLREVNLRKADLRHADFYQSDLFHARLQQSDMREANLFMANLTDARLRQVDLRKANMGFCVLQQARFSDARLSGANFASADLSGADLQKVCLNGVVLSRAILSQANLSGTDVQGVDLSECLELEAAMLQNAQFDADTVFPKGFKPQKYELVNSRCGTLRRLTRWIPSLLIPSSAVSH
jgi:uncharacterized protein YjbI with pentapeptide repeats